MNNPPFSIGQKVVALKTGQRLVKDKIYYIEGIQPEQCGCPGYEVNVGIKKTTTHLKCSKCNKSYFNDTNYIWFFSTLFAPIQTNYSDATAEILEKFKSPAETPDKILTPEKVTNQ